MFDNYYLSLFKSRFNMLCFSQDYFLIYILNADLKKINNEFNTFLSKFYLIFI